MRKFLSLIVPVFLLIGCTERPDNQTKTIQIQQPRENTEISAPLTITGQARGPWFFEGTFMVRLIDENNNELGATNAFAEGEWTTEEFVPFTAELENFQHPQTEKGILIFEKANPSGLPENAETYRHPISFAESQNTTVKLFYPNNIKDPNLEDCSQVYEVTKEIPNTETIANSTINELLKGPTDEEKEQGYYTAIPEITELQNINLQNDTATVTFNDEFNQNVSGSCNVIMIRSQIEKTLKQFSSINEVEIRTTSQEADEVLQP